MEWLSHTKITSLQVELELNPLLVGFWTLQNFQLGRVQGLLQTCFESCCIDWDFSDAALLISDDMQHAYAAGNFA